MIAIVNINESNLYENPLIYDSFKFSAKLLISIDAIQI